MADVFLTHDRRHDRKVAIKVVVVLNWFDELSAKVPR